MKAVRWHAEQRLERFLAPVEQEMRQVSRSVADDALPREARTHELMVQGTEIVALAEEQFKAPKGGRRPPTSEYGDLPVNLWAEWNVKVVRNSLYSFASGYFAQAGLLTESMLGDDRVQAAFNGFVKSITKCEPVFVPSKAAGSEELCGELEDLWEDMVPEETVENLFQWSRFCGFALCEIIWEPWSNQNRWVPRLKVWHPLYVYYNVSTRRYVAITAEGTVEIEDDDPKWMLFTPYSPYRGWIRGAVRPCPIPWLVRQFALRDAARFGEVHGLPIRLAKVPAQAPAADKARFFNSIKNLGAESVMLLPVQAGPEAAVWDATLLEAKDTSWEVFPAIRDMCDLAITLSIRGTNLTTAVGTGNSGNKAAAETHRDEDQDYAVSERRKMMRRLRTHLIRWYAIFNYGKTDIVPKKARLVDPDSEDQMEELKTQEQACKTVTAARTAGAPVNAREIYEKAGLPLIEGKEEEANKPPPAPQLPGAPGAGSGKPFGGKADSKPPEGEEKPDEKDDEK